MCNWRRAGGCGRAGGRRGWRGGKRGGGLEVTTAQWVNLPLPPSPPSPLPPGDGSPYPVVDGPATVRQFLGAVDRCYAGLRARLLRSKPGVWGSVPGRGSRVQRLHQPAGYLGEKAEAAAEAASEPTCPPADPVTSESAWTPSSSAVSPLSRCDYFVSHAPFNKIVRKALSRLHYQVGRSLEDRQQGGGSLCK